jgi:hypothetical protein
MIVCSKCYDENDDDARFCEQCGLALDRNPEGVEPAAVESCCPDCGGKVKNIREGEGVCTQCGAELVEDKDGARDEPPPELTPSRKLSRLIQEKLRTGLPLGLAIEAACDELIPGPSDVKRPEAPSPKIENEECPVCGASNDKAAAKCSGCGILFSKSSAEPIPCPRCSMPCSGERCSCGAFLTLPKLLEYVDSTVLYVCPRCKQLFNAVTVKCSDCDAGVILAARLKRYASEHTG